MPCPNDFTGETYSLCITGELSSPFANAFSISPFFPSRLCKSAAGAFASSPIVYIPYSASFFLVALPTYISSSAGSGQIFCLTSSGVIVVIALGFFISEPSFANTLLNETPILTVSPSSSSTVRRISFAISSRLPKMRLPVTSSQHSSIPKGSTKSV